MAILILLLVVIGALAAIVSGIWVAFVLGSAISKKDIPTDIKKNQQR